MSAQIQPFFDPVTNTVSYVIFDTVGGHAVVIDSVMDYDPASGRTSTRSADKIVQFIQDQRLQLDWIVETHAHADHLSAAHYLQEKSGGKIGIGAHIGQVQGVFKKLFNLEPEFATDGTQFDHQFEDEEEFHVGSLTVKALYVPGHTPADIAYQIGDAVFVGDTLFMPDVGTARCDFPGGDAQMLYRSIQKLLALPPETRLYMCHDYPSDDREIRWQSSVAEQRTSNIHVHNGISETDFVQMRNARDASLDMPTLILPAIQINIRAGALPPPEKNGVSYLKIPLNKL